MSEEEKAYFRGVADEKEKAYVKGMADERENIMSWFKERNMTKALIAMDEYILYLFKQKNEQ